MDHTEGLEKKVMQSDWRKRHFLLDMTSEMAGQWLEKTDMILLPVGSCEQHGSHLPLGTDAYQALLLACSIADKADLPIAPLVWSGLAPFQMARPGTITLRYETFTNLLFDICRSLIHHGFNKILVCLNHNANIEPMRHVSRKMKYETGAVVVIFRGAESAKKIASELFVIPSDEKHQKARHGGEREVCRILYWNPDLVHLDLAKAHKMDTPPEFPKTIRAVHYEYVGFEEGEFDLPLEMTDITSIGTLGDPCQATFEKGRIVAETVAEYYSRAIQEIKKIPVNITKRRFTERM